MLDGYPNVIKLQHLGQKYKSKWGEKKKVNEKVLINN